MIRVPREYSRMLREARKDGSRYQLIRRKVGFQELKADPQVSHLQYG